MGWDLKGVNEILLKVEERRKTHVVYPDQEDLLKCLCILPEEVKVVILGLDPYIRGEAHGLSFSSKNGKYTPSLRQIEKAVLRECSSTGEWSNNLTRWHNQGVLLLNTILSVDAGKTLSHSKIGWQDITNQIIEQVDREDVFFLLWGKEAQKAVTNKGVRIECEHPQYANYQGRLWNNNECFAKTNHIINW